MTGKWMMVELMGEEKEREGNKPADIYNLIVFPLAA